MGMRCAGCEGGEEVEAWRESLQADKTIEKQVLRSAVNSTLAHLRYCT